MSEVLFLAPRIPFQPDRIDKVRSYHLLRAIAALAPVHVACFADDDFDMAEEFELAAIARSHCMVRRSKPMGIAGAQALLAGEPVSLPAFRDRRLAEYVAKITAARPISAIYVFSGQMGQYVPESFEGLVIADLVAVDSAKFEAYAEKGRGLERWAYAREGRLLREAEAAIAARADVCLLVSAEEAALFRSRLGPDDRSGAEIRTLPNGINTVGFDPAIVAPEPRLRDCPGPRLILSGQMDHAPNVAAALRAVDHILPRVRQVLPEATLHVVGRNPPQKLRVRDGTAGCHVWGAVADMRTWIKAADLALVPVEVSRGVQNKVLEAMSMALPIVLTSVAAAGIGGTDGTHFRVEDSDRAIAEAVVDLISDPDRARTMGLAARLFVSVNASWQTSLAVLPDLLGLTGRGSRDVT